MTADGSGRGHQPIRWRGRIGRRDARGTETPIEAYPDPVGLRSVLRGLAAMHRAQDDVPCVDMAALADAAGVGIAQLPRLIATGVVAGWIAEGRDGALRLTAAGRKQIGVARVPAILLVDGDVVNLRLMRLVLWPLRYTVREARTGAAALAMLGAFTPDVVLLALNLPDMAGVDVARAIRRHRRFADTAIVAVTEAVRPGDGERLVAAGCTGYVTKPFDARTLSAIVASYC